MTTNAQNNKRILKNTLMLYIRTFVTIIVSLYTSRVVLSTLGETDFGVYNIVGGVVVFFSFIQNAMATATQRFLNFEMGQGDENSVKRVFSMSLTAHISIALLVILLGETLGLWFVTTQLNIPAERTYAVQWIYQFSILTTCVNIIRVPYHAMIVANERMNFYAYMSIIECVLKLLIVYLLLVTIQDKLIFYSILIFAVSFVVFYCYKLYCNKFFKSSRYKFFWNRALYNQLLSFSGWSLFGSAANIGAKQGINFLLNIFYGVTVNASFAIANQVQAAVASFSGNFQTAFNPQLVKSYAANDEKYFTSLIFQTSKLSFFLIYILILPVIVCAEPILKLWLIEVPEFTVPLTQLQLIFIAIDALSAPLWLSVQATGNIKRYQILMSILIFSNLPFAYGLLYLGYSPVSVLVVRVAINLITHFVRLFYIRKLFVFPVMKYLLSVIVRIIFVILLTAPIVMYVGSIVNTDIIGVIITGVVSSIVIVLGSYYLGLSKPERVSITKLIKSKL